jgi:hypothetical protein
MLNNKIELSFCPEAQAHFENVFNQIETAILPGGVFCENKDYASKVAENIARLAGVFHVFEGYEGAVISLETLQCAANIVLWYAQEFVRLFSPPTPLSELARDAIRLDNWLIELVKKKGMPSFLEKSLLCRYGPNSMRQTDRMTWALELLQNANRLTIQVYGDNRGRNRKTVVYLNAAYYGNIARGLQPFGVFPVLG